MPYTIEPNERSLPPLSLSAGAHHPSHPDYDHNVETDPPEIEPVEHRLRATFVREGSLTLTDLHEPSESALHEPGGSALRKAATQTLVETARAEKQFYLPIPNKSTFADAPSFLHDKLNTLRYDIVETQKARQRWYTEVIPDHLDTIFSTVKDCYPVIPGDSRSECTDYVGSIVVDRETDPADYAATNDLSSAYVIQESELDDHTSLDAYEIDLPAPLLVGKYITQSQYTLVPWTDGLVCMCPYKQTTPSAIMCKHELLATVRLAHADTWLLPLDEGLAVPQRARRFVSPTVATR